MIRLQKGVLDQDIMMTLSLLDEGLGNKMVGYHVKAIISRLKLTAWRIRRSKHFADYPEQEYSNLQLGGLLEGLPDPRDNCRLKAPARVRRFHLHQHFGPSGKRPDGALYFQIEKGFLAQVSNCCETPSLEFSFDTHFVTLTFGVCKFVFFVQTQKGRN